MSEKLQNSIIEIISDEKESQYANIEKLNLLGFKNLKKLSFKDFKKLHKDIKWGSIHKFYSYPDKIINVEESTFKSSYDFESTEYFYTKCNGIVPLVYRIDKKRYNKKFINDLFSILDPPYKSYKASLEYNDNELVVLDCTLAITEDIIFMFNGADISFYINPNYHLIEDNSNIFYSLLRVLFSYTNKLNEKNKIHIVYKSDYGFDKIAFDIKQVNVNIDTHYNDDFKPISQDIIKNLNNKKQSGLFILDGIPGSGKTMFIRYLTSHINRNIIFISPDMVEYITDPSFIPFLMDNSDSVLIIEDAEPALQKRGSGGRTGSISNILNLTDGLLSDCLNISIVATFNTNTKVLDDALLRKGRLINSYTFDKLNIEKSQQLLNELGHTIKVTQPMTLADIYHYKDNNKNDMYKTTKKIGFN